MNIQTQLKLQEILFSTYQKELVRLSNTEHAQKYFKKIGASLHFPIVALTRNSLTEQTDAIELHNGITYPVLRTTFFSRQPIFDYFYSFFEEVLSFNNLRYRFLTGTLNPAAGAVAPVDGYVQRGAVTESFATIRSGAGNGSNATGGDGYAAETLATSTTDVYSILVRGIFVFNTSILKSNSVIKDATFSLYVTTKDNALAQSIGVVAATPASVSALVDADYNIANFGSTRFSSDIDISSATTSAYNDYLFNSSGKAAISKTSYTKLGTRLSGDIDNTAPTWASSANSFFTVSYADVGSNLPKLVINYIRFGAGFI